MWMAGCSSICSSRDASVASVIAARQPVLILLQDGEVYQVAQLKSRLDAHTTALDLMASASSKLDELARLEPDWDSYGAQRISAIAINQANRLLLDATRHYLELGYPEVSRVKPWFIAPLADGGIQIEWRSDSGSMEVEIGGDGRVEYLIEREDGQYEDSGALKDSDWTQLIDTVCRHLI